MKSLIGFTVFLFAGLVGTSPPKTKKDDTKLVISKDLYSLPSVKYKSQHDIISILVPLNSLNFNGSTSSEEVNINIIFFVEADFDDDNKLTYKGLYSFKNGKATMVLENGQDAAAPSDDSKKVFIGAADGLYEYKTESNEAVKYGPITDNIIGIAVTGPGDIIYIVTKDHELYKVTDSGNTKTKVEDVVNPQQIVLDYSHNLYFCTEDKQVYVRTAEGVKKVKGLPANPTEINLIKPPYFLIQNRIPVVIDNDIYIIDENGASEKMILKFAPKAKPTAFAMEAIAIQYYAYDKNIYEVNIETTVELIEELQLRHYLDDETSDIQAISRNLKRNRKA